MQRSDIYFPAHRNNGMEGGRKATRRGNRRMEMSLNLAHASLIFRPVSLHCLPGEKRVFIARSSRRKSTGCLYVFFFFFYFSFRVHAIRTIMDLLEHSRFNDSDLTSCASVYICKDCSKWSWANAVSVRRARFFIRRRGDGRRWKIIDRSKTFICKFNW